MADLFPPITPFADFKLETDSEHVIYVEQCGNPEGIPVIFIHGGPGAGCSADDRRFFDPALYHIILFDQRGCGRSRPLALLDDNKTENLIADIELIRKKLDIEKWVIFGGSWGSTLSLLYAQAHPARAISLILRGIFLATKAEVHHLTQEGMSHHFPEEFDNFKSIIPMDRQHEILKAHYEIMCGNDAKAALKAAKSYQRWESCGMYASYDGAAETTEDPDLLLAESRVEAHYVSQGCFIPEGSIIENISLIAHIPLYIVHGRFDTIVTASNAWKLHKAHPKSTLHISKDSAHASREKNTASKLVEYTNEVAANLK